MDKIANLIINVVCQYSGISRDDITGTSRKQIYVIPRHVAIYIIKRHTKMTLKQLGKIFGNRDHCTIINSIRQAEAIIKYDKYYREMYNEVNKFVSMLISAVTEERKTDLRENIKKIIYEEIEKMEGNNAPD